MRGPTRARASKEGRSRLGRVADPPRFVFDAGVGGTQDDAQFEGHFSRLGGTPAVEGGVS